jgi:hypothetical protein
LARPGRPRHVYAGKSVCRIFLHYNGSSRSARFGWYRGPRGDPAPVLVSVHRTR